MPETMTVPTSTVVALFSILVMTGCSSDYKTVYNEASPDRKWEAAAVLYRAYLMSDQRLRIEVRSQQERITLYKDDGLDVYPCFEEIFWSPDSRYVGVYVNNCYASPVLVGFDVVTKRPIKPELIQSGLRNRIAQKYGLYSSERQFKGDPLAWAATIEARDAFLAMTDHKESGSNGTPTPSR